MTRAEYEQIIPLIQALASRSPSREVCGLVDSTGTLYPIHNVAIGASEFVFQKSGYYQTLDAIKHKGLVVSAIYHSHPGQDASPSLCDLETMKKFGTDMLIVSGADVRIIEYE